MRNRQYGRGCLIKNGVDAPCKKCGKPTRYVYNGTLLCVECLPTPIQHDVAVLERLIAKKQTSGEENN